MKPAYGKAALQLAKEKVHQISSAAVNFPRFEILFAFRFLEFCLLLMPLSKKRAPRNTRLKAFQHVIPPDSNIRGGCQKMYPENGSWEILEFHQKGKYYFIVLLASRWRCIKYHTALYVRRKEMGVS